MGWLLLVLLLWCLLSVPAGVLLGRGIAAGSATLAAADGARRAAQGPRRRAGSCRRQAVGATR